MSVASPCWPLTLRQQISDSDRPSTAGEVTTLKVKSEDGNHTYMLKMSLSETIGHLRQYLDKHRSECRNTEVVFHSGSIPILRLRCRPIVAFASCSNRGGKFPAYEIITLHPRRSYDDQQTLRSCGLTTNATLLLRKQKTHSLTDRSK